MIKIFSWAKLSFQISPLWHALALEKLNYRKGLPVLDRVYWHRYKAGREFTSDTFPHDEKLIIHLNRKYREYFGIDRKIGAKFETVICNQSNEVSIIYFSECILKLFSDGKLSNFIETWFCLIIPLASIKHE